MRYPERAVTADLEPTFRQMAELAAAMTRTAGEAMQHRDVDRCARLAADDETMNELHRSLFTVMLADGWPGTVEQGVDLALLGRYYERIADHAVLIGAHVAYLVSGDTAHLGTIPR
jgi:phosphate transport system protein